MATTKRESNLGKEKRGGISPSNPSTTKKATSGSVPNYLRPTVSSRTETGPTTTKTNNAKKTGLGPDPNPNLLRRRSFDRPPSAAPRVHKALISPAREKPAATRSVSFSSKSNTSASSKGVTSDKVVKKPTNNAAKPQSTLSSSRSMKKTTNNSSAPATAKKPALKKHSSRRDKHEEQDVEITKLETEEVLDQHDHVDEILNNDLGDPVLDYSESPPKPEENEHHDDEDVLQVATEVKSDDEVKDHSPGPVEVSEEHNNINVIPETEEIEDKIHEEDQSDPADQHDEDHKENEIKEEIDDEEEKIPDDQEEAKTETEEEKAEEVVVVAKTEEIEEEKQVESRQQESDEGSKEEKVEEEKNIEESKPEAAAPVVVKSQAAAAHGKKESATPYNDVIEETASKLREARKNKVLALVGAFETVIDKETSNAK
ncbi:hypothetical protein CCACVL1_09787 [Corchorus capsularis]|uniref:Calmodulin-binding domain-containing protein n=1 Tax=Corchorus capsularis TaxID=210143 RepID=A0A1R3IU79_COCAP|nr:hypothetical protein CCACVL1_09787 [Corchorus capsularis]